jgi:AraC family transcriptional regulator of arabinose operon
VKRLENCIRLSFCELPYVHIADHVQNTKPFRHADRRLDYHVLIYVIKGCIPVIEEGTEYELTPGTLFFLKGGLHHWGEHMIEGGSSWLYVHFSLKEAPEEQAEFIPYSTYLQNQEFTPSSYQYQVTLPKLIKLLNGNLLEGKLLQLAAMFHSANPMRAPYLSLLMKEILLDCYQAEHMLQNTAGRDHVLAMIKYMEEHTHSALHARELERYMNLSYKHMCALFKRKTGQKLVEYHTNLRMNEAAKLLRETSLQISEISEYMGYSDQLYFSNVFKKVYGISPRNYRNSRK